MLNCIPTVDVRHIPCLLTESHTDLTPNVTIFESATSSTITDNTSPESVSPVVYTQTATYDHVHYQSSDEEDEDEDEESVSAASSSSIESTSDWNDTASTISTATTVLPFLNKRSNTLSSIHPFASVDLDHHHEEEEKMDRPTTATANITIDSLFYPFSNLQSLIFCHQHPYIEADYKNIKNDLFKNTAEDEENINDEPHIDMDWTDISSINRIRQLTKKLLSSSSASRGIKEEDLYLMFSSPSPTEIIDNLRFGALSHLCTVSIDRFGRRKYHFKGNKMDRRQTRIHFYSHSNAISAVFGHGDIVGLADFIQDDGLLQIGSEEEVVVMDSRRPSSNASVIGSYVPHRTQVRFNNPPPNATPKKRITASEIRQQFAINKRKNERKKRRKNKKKKKVKFDPSSAQYIAKWAGKFGAPSIRR